MNENKQEMTAACSCGSDDHLRLTARCRHPENTIIKVGRTTIGEEFTFIAGPCAVESREQIFSIAGEIRGGGAQILRGGAFKPRTSPYSFQGLGREGLFLLSEAGKAYGMPVITEIMDAAQIPLFRDVDIFQVGAKNMQNFELLKALGRTDKPVVLKRNQGCTLHELLMSAEYVMAEGNSKVILCERGIRTFETATRSTMDISAIPWLKKNTHLPVFADPSHAAGSPDLIPALALAAAAAGADGLMIEVHDHPDQALCDGFQSISSAAFCKVAGAVRRILPCAFRP